MTILYTQFPTPLGTMLALAVDGRVVRLDFVDAKHAPSIDPAWEDAPRDPVLRACATQVRDYFARGRAAFDFPIALGGTAFQQRVWRAIAEVPYGETIDYAELARRAGAPGSARAAGTATGRNPIAVAIPCHRIVGSDGRLTGYAGGLDRKTHLLTLEGARLI